jgi:uncharacterized membrane protein YidH (DUF202 family)
MSAMNEKSPKKRFVPKTTELAVERTDVAIKRTRLAAERTLMAWIRTSLSMIGFGFTILKFFQYLEQSQGAERLFKSQGPRHVGLALIAFGIIILIPATIEHWHSMTELSEIDGKHRYSLGLVVAGMMAALGIVVLASAVFQWAFF